MKIDIQSRTFALTPGLRAHVERRLRYSLDAAGTRLRHIVVRLTDDNGPRGGVDKCCRIQATLAGARPVLIEQNDADLYAAVDRAAARAARAIAERVGRLVSRRRVRRQRMPDAVEPA